MVDSFLSHDHDVIEFFEPLDTYGNTRRKRKKKTNKSPSIVDTHQNKLQIKKIKPLTANQEKVFEAYKRGSNILIYGSAGTGKTFIQVALALEEIMSSQTYKKLIILRSAVSSRDIGFLPGDEKKKLSAYEPTYECIVNELYGRKDAYAQLKQRNMIEFASTSFLRGITFNNCIILLDEMQNLNEQEEKTVITRVGKDCKLLISGDIKQNDLQYERYNKSSAQNLIKTLQTMKEFTCIEMNRDDIVRSGLVKSYIIAREKLGLD